METGFIMLCGNCGKHPTNLICDDCLEAMCIGCQSENNPNICRECEENREWEETK